MGKPFARFAALAAAMAAAIGAVQAAGTRWSPDLAKARELYTGYESRGKGGKRAHRPTGIAGVQRAARKAQNVARNRRAHRG
jgi:hypothetical protein